MFRLLHFILIAVWFMAFLGQSGNASALGCSLDIFGICDSTKEAVHSADKAIGILKEGIDRFDRGQRDWQKILQDTRNELISAGEKMLSNTVLEISTQISNVGIQTRCSADFLRSRARDDLVRLVGVVSGKEPVLKPSFCMPNPPTVNFAQVESGQQDKISIDGYNLDIPGTKVFLINNQGNHSDVSSALAFPTPYLLTVNLGGNGVPLSPDSQKLVFRASDGTEIGSMNVIQPRKMEVYKFVPEPILKFCPRESRGGNKDFAGHGPAVKASANLEIRNNTELWVKLIFKANETEHGDTNVHGEGNYPLWTAPMGYVIDSFTPYTLSKIDYIDRDISLDMPTIEGGSLIRRFEIMGDTEGDDIDNCTEDDTHMNVFFNEIQVKVSSQSMDRERFVIDFSTNNSAYIPINNVLGTITPYPYSLCTGMMHVIPNSHLMYWETSREPICNNTPISFGLKKMAKEIHLHFFLLQQLREGVVERGEYFLIAERATDGILIKDKLPHNYSKNNELTVISPIADIKSFMIRSDNKYSNPPAITHIEFFY